MFAVTPDIAFAAGVERGDEVTTPEKKILARVERGRTTVPRKKSNKSSGRLLRRASQSFRSSPDHGAIFASSWCLESCAMPVYRRMSLDSAHSAYARRV